MDRNALYRNILETVVENGRLSEAWDDDELEAEVDAECRERDLDAAATAEAVEYAKSHIAR